MRPLPSLARLAGRGLALTGDLVAGTAGTLAETVNEAGRAARGTPAVERAEREWRRVERWLVCELRQRLDDLEDGDEPERRLMALMMESAEQSADQARTHIFDRVVRELVPDEVRILAALSDGSTYPLVNVAIRNKLGATTHLLLENASTVGRAAGVMLSDQVPTYLSRLHDLGLVQVLPEDPTLGEGYELVQSDSMVQLAINEAQQGGRLAGHVQRRALRISPFGQLLWDSCSPRPPEIGN